jgi:hypothetical protein
VRKSFATPDFTPVREWSRTNFLEFALGANCRRKSPVNNVLLDLDGLSSVAEVASVKRLERGRSSIEVHSKRMLPPGRSCWLRDAAGETIGCVISGSTKEGEVFVVDLRTVEDAHFLEKLAQLAK